MKLQKQEIVSIRLSDLIQSLFLLYSIIYVMRNLKILLCLVAFLSCPLVYAISAYPGLVRYKCPDGTYVDLRLKGDERTKWAVTEDGYTLLRDSLGEWCFANLDTRGEACLSGWKITATRSQDLNRFLLQIPLNIKPREGEPLLKSVSGRQADPHIPIAGKQKTLVILMQFRDLLLKNKQADFDELFNQPGYRKDGASGSVKDFYTENSYGKLDLVCDVLGPFTAVHDMAYYGGNNKSDQDEHPGELFAEALEFASSRVNLADYDMDQDGVLNNVHLIFAGYGEEAGGPAEAIWSHEALFYEPVEIGGVKLTGYSCAPELRGNNGNGISRIGVHCHEMGHSFGAMDFYDTDYEKQGDFPGTGMWDLMASGSWNNDGITPAHFNPYVKEQFGWADTKILDVEDGRTVVYPSLESNKIYRIKTDSEGDYFLLENRQQEGFDKHLPGRGLMIYHVLPQIEERSADNKINAAFPQTCYLVCAGSDFAVPNRGAFSYGEVNSGKCPFPGTLSAGEFSPATVPAALSYDEKPAWVSLKEIRQEDDGSISFQTFSPGVPGGQTLLFADSFEKNTQDWSQEQLQENTSWEIHQPKPTSSMPEATDGLRYLMMNKGGMLISLAVSRAISPAIKVGKESAVSLSFQYQNQTVLLKHGILKVLYKQIGQTVWHQLEILTDVTSGWQQYKMELPYMSSDFQIAFEGEMESGMILVDDVKVYSDGAVSIVPVPMQSPFVWSGRQGKVFIESDKSASFKIYNLQGKLHASGFLKEGRNEIELAPGLYIGVSENKASKFYVY